MHTIDPDNATARQLAQWLALLSAVAVLAAGLAYNYVDNVARARVQETDRLASLAQVIANNIEADLDATNNALAAIADRRLIRDAAEVHEAASTPRLAALVAAMPGVRALTVLDGNGVIKASSRPDLTGQDFGRRPYFTMARSHPDPLTLYVSAPFLSIQNDLVITLTRIRRDAAGVFDGVVVATLDPEYFIARLRSASYAPDVWAYVVHGSGVQLLNYPNKPHTDGSQLDRPGSLFRLHRDSGDAATVQQGRIVTTGEQRMMALRTVAPSALHMDQSIVIGLSRDAQAIMAPARQQQGIYAWSLAALALLGAASLALAQRRRREVTALQAQQLRERQEHAAAAGSELRFRTLIEDAPLAIAILRHGRFIYTNPRYRALHGYAEHDTLDGLPWRAMIAAASRQVLAEQERLIEIDTPQDQNFEALGLGKEGRLVPVLKVTTRVMLADGPATLVFTQDISAQKRAEEAMMQARDAAEAASRGKAEFLANMSHEIRSPLNAILGLAYLLERLRLESDALGMVAKIRAAGQSLLGIINDILDVSKIEAGHMSVEQAPFQLQEVLDHVAGAMGVAASAKGIELLIAPPPPGVAGLSGDALRLQQVLLNLVSNAVKFTAAGQVALDIAQAGGDGEAVRLCFCVRDTGIGIDPALHAEIFSPFTQADTSTTRRFGGTGLGLTICRQLVRLMGGELALDSAPGQGSSFSFTLPFAPLGGSRFSSPDMLAIRALVVDASAAVRASVAAVAGSLGWQVGTADSGAQALSLLFDAPGTLPDVVLLDWQNTGSDGLAMVRAIRQADPGRRCAIVLMAPAHALPELACHADVALADAVLSKPVMASGLYDVVLAARGRALAPGIDQVCDAPAPAGNAPALAGVRVLVVDDSEINREVVRRILSDEGAVLAYAHDGQQALDWLLDDANQADVVLMDVQMPVMDGIEATRRLRRVPRLTDLPVIALTAGAFAAQQQAALAAGMNHFISKPFDVPAMIALLRQATRRIEQFADSPILPHTLTQPGHPDPGAHSGVLDLARGLQLWRDRAAYLHYLRHFRDGYRDTVDNLRRLLAEHDNAAAAELAHKLVGSAASLALPATHSLAHQVERLLRTNEGEVGAGLAALERALGLALAAIDRLDQLDTPETGTAALADTGTRDAAALLRQLLAALDGDDPAPAEDVLRQLAGALPAIMLEPLWGMLGRFEFRAAEAHARTLLLQVPGMPE